MKDGGEEEPSTAIHEPEQQSRRPYSPLAEDRSGAIFLTTIANEGTSTIKDVVSPDKRLISLRHPREWWSFYIDPYLIVQDATGHVVHDPRDFLAIERTHLAYVRTSNAIAMLGTTIAQLFILHHAGEMYGKGLAVCAYLIAILMIIASAIRTIFVQNKIIAGHMVTVIRLFIVMTMVLMMLLIAAFGINLTL